MRIAFVAGGWHYPFHFFRSIAAQSDSQVELFCIGHREPDDPRVEGESKTMLKVFGTIGNPMERKLCDLDAELYERIASPGDIRSIGWTLRFLPNTQGDWQYLNQWIDYFGRLDDFDLVVFAHDDTFIRRTDLIAEIRARAAADPDTMLWTNGRYPEAPKCYTRGSFEVFRTELIRKVGGHIPMADTGLDRTGKTDTPEGMEALSAWNANGEPLRVYTASRGMKVGYLSEYYRVSKWLIEGERGYLHKMGGAPWSYTKGLSELGVL